MYVFSVKMLGSLSADAGNDQAVGIRRAPCFCHRVMHFKQSAESWTGRGREEEAVKHTAVMVQLVILLSTGKC